MSFGAKIFFLRKRLSLSQTDFGAKFGVTQKVISNIESERSEPTHELLHDIARLGVSYEWLMSPFVDPEEFDFYDTCLKAIASSKATNRVISLTNIFNEFIVTGGIIDKIQTVKGKDFISKLSESFHGKGERMLVVWHDFLTHLCVDTNIAVEDAKVALIERIETFTPPSRLYTITNADKDRLIEWIQTNFSNIEALEILSSSQAISDILSNTKSELNIFNRLTT